jgi:formiminotetrahydrofolate cyclodeaminase
MRGGSEGPPGELADLSLRELLEALSQRTPAPGGGAASAWTGAVAAALVEMAAAYAELPDVGQRAAALRAELLRDGERELRSYEPVLEAQRLPEDDPGRAERLAAALSAASEAPLSIARACAAVAGLAADVAGRSKRSLAGDAIAAAVLAEAACRAAVRLVEINLRESADARLEEAVRLAGDAAAARERALRADFA